MRTNVVLDDELVEEACRLTGIKAKKDIIREALLELIASKKRRNLLDLFGKIRFADGYDHKALRKGR